MHKLTLILGVAAALAFSGGALRAEEPAKPAAKEAPKPKADDDKYTKKDGGEGGNPMVRFFTHTVGEPMRKGLFGGGKKMEKGLKSGADKIEDAFTTSDEERKGK